LILQRFKWAAARLGFYSYIAFSLITVVGGYLTAPVMTYYFFGDWRFWKHLSPAWKLFFHGWKMAGLILRGQNDGFLLSVPLTSPPNTSPDSTVVRLSRDWEHGGSCGPCARCCELIGCPVLDTERGLCLGYDSFFWRCFNCGRFPSAQPEIEYYSCPKWVMRPQPLAGPQPYPVPSEEALSTD
jgi:hypothetical protein